MIKLWLNYDQIMIESCSNYDWIMIKLWSNYDQIRIKLFILNININLMGMIKYTLVSLTMYDQMIMIYI